MLYGILGILFLVSCNNEDDVLNSPKSTGREFKIQIASPIDIESLLKNDSVVEVPVNIIPISNDGTLTKSVVEEVVPKHAVLTSRRGLTMLYFGSFYGQMISDVHTLSVTVKYNYGQWVNSHTGTYTGYAPAGSINSTRVQKAVQNKIDDSSGSWTLSTSVYYPITNYLGQTLPGVKQYYPFHYNNLELYYTWIDGNN